MTVTKARCISSYGTRVLSLVACTRISGQAQRDMSGGLYSALREDAAASTEDNLYELGRLTKQSSESPAAAVTGPGSIDPKSNRRKTHIVMPQYLHEKLNAYKDGTAGDSDSDSDDDATVYEGKDSLRTIRDRQYKGKGVAVDSDIEAQPAWARRGSLSESNVLRVRGRRQSVQTDHQEYSDVPNCAQRRFALPIILVLLLVVLAAFFAGHTTLSSTSTSVYQGSKKKITLDDVMRGTFYAEQQQLDWLPEGMAIAVAMWLSIEVSFICC